MKTVMVRPSERAAREEGKKSFDQILAGKMAPGFAAGLKRLHTCEFIIVMSEDGKDAFYGAVDKLKLRRHPLPSRKSRSDIFFDDPEPMSADQISRALAGIKWTSNNVRYIDWTP